MYDKIEDTVTILIPHQIDDHNEYIKKFFKEVINKESICKDDFDVSYIRNSTIGRLYTLTRKVKTEPTITETPIIKNEVCIFVPNTINADEENSYLVKMMAAHDLKYEDYYIFNHKTLEEGVLYKFKSVPVKKDPVHCVTPTTSWFFWDETWTHQHGPYLSEEEARKQLDKYSKTLETDYEMSFEEALIHMKNGGKVRRRGWSDDDYYFLNNEKMICLHEYKMFAPITILYTSNIMSNDWVRVKDEY